MSSSRSPACPSPWTVHTRPLVLGVLVIVVVGGVTAHIDGGREVSLGDGKGHVPTHIVVVYRRAGRGRGIVLAVAVGEGRHTIVTQRQRVPGLQLDGANWRRRRVHHMSVASVIEVSCGCLVTRRQSTAVHNLSGVGPV